MTTLLGQLDNIAGGDLDVILGTIHWKPILVDQGTLVYSGVANKSVGAFFGPNNQRSLDSSHGERELGDLSMGA